jgi:hypothetical protein
MECCDHHHTLAKVIWTAKKSKSLFCTNLQLLVPCISAGRQGIPASRRPAAASLCPGLGRQLYAASSLALRPQCQAGQNLLRWSNKINLLTSSAHPTKLDLSGFEP